MIRSRTVMMPTLRQIKKLNQLLMILHMQCIPPATVRFLEKNNKPIIMIEPLLRVKRSVYYINWEGKIDEEMLLGFKKPSSFN